MKQKTATVIILLVIAAAIVWFAFSRSGKSKQAVQEVNQNQDTNSQAQTPEPPPQSSNNVINGTLKASDNQALGNLMVVTSTSTIYLRTSRDFGNLLDKAVSVSIDGDLTKFTLIDIKPQ